MENIRHTGQEQARVEKKGNREDEEVGNMMKVCIDNGQLLL